MLSIIVCHRNKKRTNVLLGCCAFVALLYTCTISLDESLKRAHDLLSSDISSPDHATNVTCLRFSHLKRNAPKSGELCYCNKTHTQGKGHAQLSVVNVGVD